MTYEQTSIAYQNQWRLGRTAAPDKNGVFPYDIRYCDDTFVTTHVPIVACLLQEVEHERVNKYIDAMASGDNFGPAWVSYGKRLKDGSFTKHEHGRLFVHDGNHRVAARRALDCFYTTVVMPMSNYEQFMRDYK